MLLVLNFVIIVLVKKIKCSSTNFFSGAALLYEILVMDKLASVI